ncbi:hypothetical protein Leryth_026791 [Lithospermum erythrorhizon]|nr:hypothetical protein Leryth_026791 [Lithospermum erythrorhizon]
MTTVSRNLQFSILFVLCYSCTFISVLDGRDITNSKLNKNDQTSSLSIRAVNLGGWLVTEGWIKPSLFDAIPNKDFLLWEWVRETFI